jgi:hypothetical protein
MTKAPQVMAGLQERVIELLDPCCPILAGAPETLRESAVTISCKHPNIS